MYIYYILCSIIIIPSIYSRNATPLKTDPVVNNVVNGKVLTSNTTKLPLKSEIISSSPEKSVIKDNIPVDLLNLEEGFGKTKEKPVHARKGVDLLDETDTKNITVDLNTLEQVSSNMPDKTKPNLKKPPNTTETVPTGLPKNNRKGVKDWPKQKITTVSQAEIESPKKPTKTVYETLANFDQGPVTAKSSAHTLLLDQIPSTKRDSTTGKSPGMITPIVITILVVPMFAVLGYMALRRGQEAWKNRHYKRMDFLLDGMYND